VGAAERLLSQALVDIAGRDLLARVLRMPVAAALPRESDLLACAISR